MAGIAGPLDYPIYIPTRGRPKMQLTATALLALGISPTLVVEDAEADAYMEHNPDCRVVVWPQRYLDEYEKTPELDPHPTTGAAHNFAWDHSAELGFSHHWIMDDNIRFFLIRSKGRRARVANPVALHFNEVFIRKWKNLAGFSLAMSPFMRGSEIRLNTRLYCATLYRNDLHEYGIRWRRGLNDDTVVSLDILKTGYWCTAENSVVGIMKMGTSRKSRLPGGMTDFYAQGGFIKKSAELVRLHPDCTQTVVKFNRIHHTVDFSKFTQQLIPVDQTTPPPPPAKPTANPKRVTKDRVQSDALAVGVDTVNRLVMGPATELRYPIYVPSKGRADRINVTRLLTEQNIPFTVVVEPQDADDYRQHFRDDQLLVMDKNDQGIHYVRNYAKQHATEQGTEFHWQLDDDIRSFKVRRDGKNRTTNPAHVLNLVETVTDLYTNIGAASPMYDTWAFQEGPIIKLNRMFASANLLRNDPNITFRPDIVEDVDTSLQYLAAGYCTLIFATALITVPTTPDDEGGLGVSNRIGEGAQLRCDNLVAQWGANHFKVITKPKWNNAPRLAPSRIWSTYKQQPELK